MWMCAPMLAATASALGEGADARGAGIGRGEEGAEEDAGGVGPQDEIAAVDAGGFHVGSGSGLIQGREAVLHPLHFGEGDEEREGGFRALVAVDAVDM